MAQGVLDIHRNQVKLKESLRQHVNVQKHRQDTMRKHMSFMMIMISLKAHGILVEHVGQFASTQTSTIYDSAIQCVRACMNLQEKHRVSGLLATTQIRLKCSYPGFSLNSSHVLRNYFRRLFRHAESESAKLRSLSLSLYIYIYIHIICVYAILQTKHRNLLNTYSQMCKTHKQLWSTSKKCPMQKRISL